MLLDGVMCMVDSRAINAVNFTKENKEDCRIMEKWLARIVRKKTVFTYKIRFRKFNEIYKKIIPEIVVKIYQRLFKGGDTNERKN